MSKGKRWTKAEDEILALGIEEGASYEEIGKVVDRTHKACALRALSLRRQSEKTRRDTGREAKRVQATRLK